MCPVSMSIGHLHVVHSSGFFRIRGTPDFKVPRRRPIFYGKGLCLETGRLKVGFTLG